jgi:hypothetical protein
LLLLLLLWRTPRVFEPRSAYGGAAIALLRGSGGQPRRRAVLSSVPAETHARAACIARAAARALLIQRRACVVGIRLPRANVPAPPLHPRGHWEFKGCRSHDLLQCWRWRVLQREHLHRSLPIGVKAQQAVKLWQAEGPQLCRDGTRPQLTRCLDRRAQRTERRKRTCRFEQWLSAESFGILRCKLSRC